jgi:hypothetical protein
MLQQTSNLSMRPLLALAIAVTLLGVPGTSNAFTCSLMPAADVQNEPCSHCPSDKQQESCPLSACVLICPYTVETTAVLAGEGLPDAHMLPVQLSSVLIHPPVSDTAIPVGGLTDSFDSGPLYLLNRVLLI